VKFWGRFWNKLARSPCLCLVPCSRGV